MENTIKQYLTKKITEAAGVSVEQVELEHPEAEEHGDYSTNVALVLKGGRPMAEKIKEAILRQAQDDSVVAKVEVAGPGFINIWLQNEYLVKELERVIIHGQEYGKLLAINGKRVMIEFTDPNPFKEFHIGHLYSNVVGESVCRLMESQGHDVWRVCYQGDVGLHVAKSVWGMQKLQAETPGEEASPSERAKYLGQAYAAGAAAYEEGAGVKAEIDEVNKKIYMGADEVKSLYDMGRRWSLEYFDTIYNRLGTKFKRFYFESEAGQMGVDLVKAHMADGVFEESEGAVVFRGEKHGLHTRVFINSAGLPTYEAKELGLAPTKYKDFAYDLSIILTGNEIDEYFKVLLKALELISPELASKTRHLSHGMVRLPSGKMSSRTGDVITGEWLLNEAADRARKISPDTVDPEVVGKAAVKYALLRSGVGKDIEFDFDESVSFEGNSGPYLQYTHARTQSVLAKANITPELRSSPLKLRGDREVILNDEERSIVRYLYRFPEVVEEAAGRFAPNLVCNFLYELAQRYNTFYNKHSILSAGSEEAKNFRIGLTAAVGQVVKNGLSLLGIEAPERM